MDEDPLAHYAFFGADQTDYGKMECSDDQGNGCVVIYISKLLAKCFLYDRQMRDDEVAALKVTTGHKTAVNERPTCSPTMNFDNTPSWHPRPSWKNSTFGMDIDVFNGSGRRMLTTLWIPGSWPSGRLYHRRCNQMMRHPHASDFAWIQRA